jgi:hypothetical protein
VRRPVPALVVLIVLACGCVRAAEKSECWDGDRTIKKEIAGFTLTISRYHDPSLPPAFEECRAVIRDARRHVIFSAHDPGMALVVAGQDVNGDGAPEVVLEGDSGGNHGTKTYYVISLGGKPGLIIRFDTDAVPAKFVQNESSHRTEIRTWDGNFFMLDGMSAAFSPYPAVYLQIDGARLHDISPQHRADYDKAIRKLKSSLPAADFARFRAIDESWQKAREEEPASQVLQIAVAYLYSGRSSLARKTIMEMWPPFDQERIWRLILKTRQKGILQYVRNRKPDYSIPRISSKP